MSSSRVRVRRLARRALAVLATGLSIAGAASEPPRCPEGGEEPYPPRASIDAAPAVATWRDLTALPESCGMTLDASAPLTVALAGRFTHAGTVEDIAERVGAVSATIGLPYWSVTDRDWKPLVTEATALGSPDAADGRADFEAGEILGGETLYFAQNDSRSWGMNVYRLRALEVSSDRLVIETDNVSPIRYGPVTLFAPRSLASVSFVERLEGTTWGYFALSVIRESAFEGREKSLINRQAALYRLLIGARPDGEPPLAP